MRSRRTLPGSTNGSIIQVGEEICSNCLEAIRKLVQKKTLGNDGDEKVTTHCPQCDSEIDTKKR